MFRNAAKLEVSQYAIQGQKIKWNDTDTNELTNISLILNKTMEQVIEQFSYRRVKI